MLKTRVFFRIFTAVAVLGACASAHATSIPFSGEAIIIEDLGGAVYSGVSVGQVFVGQIDDQTFNASVSDGTTLTAITCCTSSPPDIGLVITNDVMVMDQDQADEINFLIGAAVFSIGDKFDLIDIEGDQVLGNGHRLEIGVSFLFSDDTFADDDPSNYPVDLQDALFATYFVIEDDALGDEIFLAQGRFTPVPLPASLWLISGAAVVLSRVRRRA